MTCSLLTASSGAQYSDYSAIVLINRCIIDVTFALRFLHGKQMAAWQQVRVASMLS